MANVSVMAELCESLVTAEAVMADFTLQAPASLTTVVWTKDHDQYQGAFEFTPSDEAQKIATKNLVVCDDIIIKPIPSNYGRIEWNGSYLTVR